MLAGSSASSAFRVLFCAVSAGPGVAVGIHLRFASLIEDGGDVVYVFEVFGPPSGNKVLAKKAMMCLLLPFITRNGFDPELLPSRVFREAMKPHMRVLAETIGAVDGTTTDRKCGKCHGRFLRAGAFSRERTGIIAFCIVRTFAWTVLFAQFPLYYRIQTTTTIPT